MIVNDIQLSARQQLIAILLLNSWGYLKKGKAKLGQSSFEIAAILALFIPIIHFSYLAFQSFIACILYLSISKTKN